MKELIKSIICNIFPSEDMKAYLCEHVDDLRKSQIMDMIAGAMIPLERKQRFFERLAEIEEANGAVSMDEYLESESYWEAPYRMYAEKIAKALADLHIKSKEGGVLLMRECELREGEHKLLGDLPFFSYDKFDTYLDGYMENIEDYIYDSTLFWHELEKYVEDEKGDLKEVCDYIFVNGEVMFYTYCEDFDCWPDSDLNLPVPFQPGDIIEVNAAPFSKKKKGVILQIQDNHDCCAIQVLHLDSENMIDNAALKHSSFFYDDNGSIVLSALYTASIYKGALKESEDYLKIVSEFVDGDEAKGDALWCKLWIPLEEFTKEYIENNVKVLK